MSIRLLESVVFYSIGILSSNLLASVEANSKTREAKIARFHQLTGEAIGKHAPLIEQMNDIVGEYVCRLEDVEDDEILAYKLKTKRRFMKDHNLVDAAPTLTPRQKRLAIAIDESLLRFFHEKPQEFDDMAQKALDAVSQVVTISDAEKDSFKSAFREDFNISKKSIKK
ncbi:MAG: hypothetical protein LBR92_02965 [Puniceicoccales bacterium]|nr:hypothetical protein [Puniceicoccales bacterium]